MNFEDMTESELRAVLDALARKIISQCRNMRVEKPLFVLLVFNDPKVGQYVSNCDRSREDVVR